MIRATSAGNTAEASSATGNDQPVCMLIIAALKVTGRAPAMGEVKWFRRPHLAAAYRLGGVLLLAGAVGLAVST